MTIERGRIALDTNVLAYAERVFRTDADRAKGERALGIVTGLGPERLVVPAQALGELYNVLLKRGGREPEAAQAAVESWRAGPTVADTRDSTIALAAGLARRHRLSIWDAVMLAAATELGCSMLLSEDMQDSFVWRGVRVVNPFRAEVDEELASLTAGRS